MNESSDFLRACRGLPVRRTPVWLMRQAGRYLPEYRQVRSRYGFLEVCKTPELAVEVTLQPVDRLGVDAAILFSDILIPVEAMGLPLAFTPAPVLAQPVRTEAAVAALRVTDPEETTPFVLEAIRLLRRALSGRVPLIGFGGAPFTLACYMIEGQGSRQFLTVKRMMYQEPDLFRQLLDKVTEASIRYLKAQATAGAEAIQIFDTWGGILSPADYQRFVLPFSRRLFDALADTGVPLIHFVKGAGTMLDLVRQAGGDVIGLDWMVGLDRARDMLGPEVAVQGNLDPTLLLGNRDGIAREVQRILTENAARPGHIFNLGHGILPEVPVENAKFLVDCVHRWSESQLD
jgi:uroporphyrinogen decarboxylase